MSKLLLCLTLFLIIGYINCKDVITFQSCDDVDDSVCTITEVRVDPCKEGKSKKPCKFKSGSNATIEFDFIPNFTAEKLVTQAYSVTALLDLPLIGMDRDGCKFTECPTKSGENSTYTNSIFMSPAFPLLNYNVKWRTWDEKNPKKDCCFTFKIKLVR